MKLLNWIGQHEIAARQKINFDCLLIFRLTFASTLDAFIVSFGTFCFGFYFHHIPQSGNFTKFSHSFFPRQFYKLSFNFDGSSFEIHFIWYDFQSTIDFAIDGNDSVSILKVKFRTRSQPNQTYTFTVSLKVDISKISSQRMIFTKLTYQNILRKSDILHEGKTVTSH